LLICNEYLAAQIASIHNLAFYLWLITEARNQIMAGTFYEWKNKMVKQMAQRL
jgi:queuine tRNA-ribosyltransferase